MSFPKVTDNFYFFQPANASKEYLYITGGKRSPELCRAVERSGVTTIVINHWEGENIDWIADYKEQIRGLSIAAFIRDLSAITRLNQLQKLGIWGGVEQVDFSQLSNLRILGVEARNVKGNIGACRSLEELTLVGAQIPDLRMISRLSTLRRLELQEMPLKSLGGIESLQKLEKIQMGRVAVPCLEGIQELKSLAVLFLAAMRNLRRISALCSLKSLRDLHLERCGKVQDINCIERMLSLEKLTLESIGTLSNIRFLAALRNLEHLALSEGTKVADGKLDVILTLPKLKRVVFRNRREYTQRAEEINRLLAERG